MRHCLTKANENIIPWLSQIETKQKPISEHDIALFSPLTDVSQGLSNRGCENCVCPSVYVCMSNIYLLLQFCTDYNQTWINMIWAVTAKTLLCPIFHKWHRIKVNCVYISRCNWYCTSGMPAWNIRGSHIANFDHTACYRHSTLTTPERCLVPTETAYGIERCVKTLQHTANQEVQLTVHHLNPLNKHLCRR